MWTSTSVKRRGSPPPPARPGGRRNAPVPRRAASAWASPASPSPCCRRHSPRRAPPGRGRSRRGRPIRARRVVRFNSRTARPASSAETCLKPRFRQAHLAGGVGEAAMVHHLHEGFHLGQPVHRYAPPLFTRARRYGPAGRLSTVSGAAGSAGAGRRSEAPRLDVAGDSRQPGLAAIGAAGVAGLALVIGEVLAIGVVGRQPVHPRHRACTSR